MQAPKRPPLRGGAGDGWSLEGGPGFYDLKNANISALIVSAWVVSIPCGKPL